MWFHCSIVFQFLVLWLRNVLSVWLLSIQCHLLIFLLKVLEIFLFFCCTNLSMAVSLWMCPIFSKKPPWYALMCSSFHSLCWELLNLETFLWFSWWFHFFKKTLLVVRVSWIFFILKNYLQHFISLYFCFTFLWTFHQLHLLFFYVLFVWYLSFSGFRENNVSLPNFSLTNPFSPNFCFGFSLFLFYLVNCVHSTPSQCRDFKSQLHNLIMNLCISLGSDQAWG